MQRGPAQRISVSPTIVNQLCRELRHIREAAGLSGENVAYRIGWSPSKVSRYETGRATPQPDEVKRLLTFYGVQGEERTRLLAIAEKATLRPWWHPYLRDLTLEQEALFTAEHDATHIGMWASNVVPLLLQTNTYTEALYESLADLYRIPPMQRSRLVTMCVKRRARLQDVAIMAVIAEPVLSRQIGSSAVMQTQLEHLLSLARLPNINIRVLPAGSELPLDVCQFTLYGYAEAPQQVAIEHVGVPHLITDDQEAYMTQLVMGSLVTMSNPILPTLNGQAATQTGYL